MRTFFKSTRALQYKINPSVCCACKMYALGCCTCSVGVETSVAGFTGGRVCDKETRVAWRTGFLLPRCRQLDGSVSTLTADLWLDPLVHELSLRHTQLIFSGGTRCLGASEISLCAHLCLLPRCHSLHYLSLRVTWCVGVEVVSVCARRSRCATPWARSWKNSR